MKFLLNNGTEVHPFEIEPGVTIIGRDRSCQLQLKSTMISRRHVECVREGATVRLRDLDSANGTIVNGIRVKAPVILRDGDLVTLGNIKLTFQGSDGAAAPPPPPPPSARVFTDLPTNGAAAAAAPSQPGAGASAQPAQPYAEDAHTPPDGTLLPEVYKVETAQPLITQRDGRWFLRDPRTNREVEIVPKSGPTTEEKHKRLITYAVIGGASLLAVVLVLIAVLGNSDTPKLPQHQYTDARYNAIIDEAVKAFEATKREKIPAILEDAHKDRPDRKVAGTLRDVMLLLKKSGPDMANLDYNNVDTQLRLLEERPITSTLKGQMASWRAEIELAQGDIALLTTARDCEARGDFVKAYETVSKLRADSPIRKANVAYIRSLQDMCRGHFVSLAERAKAEQKWDDANGNYEQAIKYAPSMNHVQEIIEMQKVCAREKVNMINLDDGKAKFEAQDFPGALLLVDKIEEDSLYFQDGQLLKQKVGEAQHASTVKSMYAACRAQEAIDYIDKHKIESMFTLRDKLMRVLAAFTEAQKLDQMPARSSEAANAYQRVIDLEPDEENCYHKAAKKRYDELIADKGSWAQEYVRKAYEALDKRDYDATRRFIELAQAVDPTVGAELLSKLDSEANKAYFNGLGAKTTGNKIEARTFLLKAKAMAKPGSDIYTKAVSELKELE